MGRGIGGEAELEDARADFFHRVMRASVGVRRNNGFLAVTFEMRVQRIGPVDVARQGSHIDVTDKIAQHHRLAILAEQAFAKLLGDGQAFQFGLCGRQIAKHHQIGKIVEMAERVAGAKPALDSGFKEHAHMLRHALPFRTEARLQRRQIEHVDFGGGSNLLVIGNRLRFGFRSFVLTAHGRF
jgi:hypothetical protein